MISKSLITKLVFMSAIILMCSITLAEQPKEKIWGRAELLKSANVSDVKIVGGFWGKRLETNRKTTIGYELDMCEKTGRIDNFAIAAGLKEGKFNGYYFNDSDVFKILEGAAYILLGKPYPELESRVDGIIDLIAAAQEDNGYLYTARTIDPENVPERSGKERWGLLRYSHELYNVGHLYEAAAAYYEATGKRKLLDVAIKNAELLLNTFGPDKKLDTSGHEEIELGLVRLYEVTGDQRYLKLSKFFIEQRGQHTTRQSYKDFRQDHKSFTQQDQAVGHAVSGAYLYSAATEHAIRTNNRKYQAALEKISKDIASTKLFITGADADSGEKFGKPYKLDNLKGYNETCATIANAMWNHRMFLLTADGKYLDVMERALYNGVLSGISLDGKSFFYSNPLSSDGVYKFTDDKCCTRVSWFSCACCPSNLVRLIPAIGRYVAASRGTDIYVTMFIKGTTKLATDDNVVTLSQKTQYPWQGRVQIKVQPRTEGKDFIINIRVPGWARGIPVEGGLYSYMNNEPCPMKLTVNGRSAKYGVRKGFAYIKRKWNKGDVIELDMQMQIRKVLCDSKVEANIGKVAIERGPLVYCAEWFDNNGKVSGITVADDEEFDVTFDETAFGGANIIKAKKRGKVFIPYYAWSNRGVGEMSVWLDKAKSSEAAESKKDYPRHGITVTEPATVWKQALPCGNGSIGAMAYGDPRYETILLNHQALYYPLWPKPNKVPNMAQYLPQLRQLIAKGKYTEAENFWNQKLKKHNYSLEYAPFTNPFHPACDLVMRSQWDKPDNFNEISDYKQRLDFEKAEVTTSWKQGEAEYEQRMFVSRSDDVVVVRLAGTKTGSVTTNIGLIPHDPQTDVYPVRMGRDKEYLLSHKPYKDRAITYSNQTIGQNLVLRGRYPDGREFGAVARVINKSGKARLVDDYLSVTNTDEVMILVKLFANENDPSGAIRKLNEEINTLSSNYERLIRPHIKEYRELFFRMSLDLDADGERKLSNKELIAKTKKGQIPTAFVERLYEFGRYILICSSKPKGLPANLQGLWSGTWTPSWSCDYTLNENIQMAYWQVLPGNMPEVAKPYFDYFDSLIPDWKTNARQFLGCKGIMGYMRSSDHGLMLQYAPWQFWTGTAGWLGQLYYDYYIYTNDTEFLKERALPFLKEVALFYEDFLFEGPDGKMVFSPSMSPENRPGNSRSKVTVNATMDVAIAKEVLTNLIAACKTLDTEHHAVQRWQNILQKMPDYEIAPDGRLKEWLHSDLKNNDGHRHVSHMYPLFPGFEVDSDEGDPAIRQACQKVLDTKHQAENEKLSSGRAVFGWSYAHLANCFARLGQGQKALDCLRGVAATSSEQNLFSLFDPPEGPFQIDGNCGFSAAVLEMLIYTRPGLIRVLPALPKDWSKGKAEGMLCRGCIEADINWDINAGWINLKLISSKDQSITITYPSEVFEVVSNTNANIQLQRSGENSKYWTVDLHANCEVQLHARLEKTNGHILKPASFKHYVDYFNNTEEEGIVNYIPNSKSWQWIADNAPFFECPDKNFEKIYYYRWWTFRKHIKKTEDGFVVTEFLAPVGHAGKHNTISCGASHHINEARWLADQKYMDDYIKFWFRKGRDGKPVKHFHNFSSWMSWAIYERALVTGDMEFAKDLLNDMVADYYKWEQEKQLAKGLFWQYDVRDGMEESISGSRKDKNARPTISSYMYANAVAISKIAGLCGDSQIENEFAVKAAELKRLVEKKLWNPRDEFFEVLYPTGKLCGAREQTGYVPWYFNLPSGGKRFVQAWQQVVDVDGFKAPMGIMTAERRHRGFRNFSIGTCEWDGAIWPFATTQTLKAWANLLRNYEQNFVRKNDYFDAFGDYVRSHNRDGKPYIGEYLDEMTGQWLTEDSPSSRYYNHSGFCDLVITGLVGIMPSESDNLVIEPLVPEGKWQWFALDKLPWRGHKVAVIWDETGSKYGLGRGLSVFIDGVRAAQSDSLNRITVTLP